MSLLQYVRLKEYIVTLHDSKDLDTIYDDLESQGKAPEGTDIVRAVKCLNRRPKSRNTHYFLTEWEAEELKRDPRVKKVSLHPRELGIKAGEFAVRQISDRWNKSTGITNLDKNFALLRCTEGEQRPGWGSNGISNQSGTVTLTQTGKNVDVIIVDGDGLVSSHPEFAVNSDGTGGSRALYYNWYQHDPEVKGTPAGTYVNSASGPGGYHAIHVMGTTGGNTQGWARDANLYNIYYFAGALGDSDFPYVYDYVREFHRTKSVNPATGRKNPTICNNSWGESIFPTEWTFSDITAVTYRGTRYEAPTGTLEFSGQSGVYSSSALLSSFTGDPENIAQRITTSGSEVNETPEAEYSDIPVSWQQSGNQAYLIALSRPDSTYTVSVNVTSPLTVQVRHNVAVGVSSSTVTLSGEIGIIPPSGLPESYSQGPLTGTDVETTIDETLTFNEIGIYTIVYNTTITSDSEDITYATLLDCLLNISGGTPSATITDLGSVIFTSKLTLTLSEDPYVGSNDDGYWELNLPFTVTYLNVNYTVIYIGTNGYLTFGDGSVQYAGLGPSVPNLPKIMVGAADNSIQRLWFGTQGSSPNRTYTVQIEGNASTSGTIGNPGMEYQYTFYESNPTQIDLVIEKNNRKINVGAGFTTTQLNDWGFISGQRIPARVDALDSDVEDAIDEGIIVVGAAGNGRWKHDLPGGPDWDNTFEMANRYPGSVSQPYYYMRGSSPTANDDLINGNYDLPNICVGAIDITRDERKRDFSDCGPGVDIYAPGTSIISAWNNSNNATFVADTRGGGNLAKISGTSMASPQVCGVLACALEIYPNMTQEQAKEYILGISKIGQINDTGGGPTDFNSLQGSPNRYLFYRLERPASGRVFPKINYKLRPATGSVFPRPIIRRTL